MPTTVYANASDGEVRKDTTGSDWAGARDATAGDSVTDGGTSTSQGCTVYLSSGGNTRIIRAFFKFDVSAITVKPSAVTLNIYGWSRADTNFFVVKGTQWANGAGVQTALHVNDFDAIDGWVAGANNDSNVTKYSAAVDTWDITDYNTITLTDDALNDIRDQDVLRIVLIEREYDLINNSPGHSGNTLVRLGWYYADETGTSKDPYLSITEGTGWTNMEEESAALISDDYTINTFSQDVLSAQHSRNVNSVPLSLGVNGPRHLRGRTTSYSPSLGGRTKK